MTTGSPFPDGARPEVGDVILLSAEDDIGDTIRPRLEAAGADLERILVWRFKLPAMMQQVFTRIEVNKIDLVVMDPMASHLSGGIKRHSDNVRKVTDPMAELSELRRRVGSGLSDEDFLLRATMPGGLVDAMRAWLGR